jgi:hypothetical protein
MVTRAEAKRSTLVQIMRPLAYGQREHVVGSLRELTNDRWHGLKRLRGRA